MCQYKPVPKDAERHWDVNLILFINIKCLHGHVFTSFFNISFNPQLTLIGVNMIKCLQGHVFTSFFNISFNPQLTLIGVNIYNACMGMTVFTSFYNIYIL